MENQMKDTASTRDKILHATLNLIGIEGFQNITIKKIADLADVNIAAVNYHFGSKTNVINEAIRVLNKNLMQCFEILENKDIPPLDRIRSFLRAYMERAMEYPDVFKNFVYSAINNCMEKNYYIEFLKKVGIDKIKGVLQEAGLDLEDEALTMKMVQMIGAMELPILLGNRFKQLSGLDYNNKEIRDRYIEIILNSLLA